MGKFIVFVITVEFGGEGADLGMFVSIGDGFMGLDMDRVFDEGIGKFS